MAGVGGVFNTERLNIWHDFNGIADETIEAFPFGNKYTKFLL